jgi:UDP-N-acetylmuramate: L-alanyl-gamma-D-glutamyl-meso-diaminopimelate ligase
MKIHLIGVCGTAMATLAALLKRRGYVVQGSDQGVYPPMSEFLAAEGITAFDGYDASHITGDLSLVVVGNAISRGNPELETVLAKKVRYCSLPEAVREHFLWGARSIVIAGTHGKTTTTSLTGWMLTAADLDPTVLVGGIAKNFGDGGSSYRVGGGREFVIEGDEYDSAFFDKTAKFLKYLPDIAVINNVEFDHADIYADLAAVLQAFRRLTLLVPRNGLLLLGHDSEHALGLKPGAVSPVETFGFDERADWVAHDLRASEGIQHFSVRHRRDHIGTFDLPLLGAHNVRNALAAIAVGHAVGLDAATMARGLRSFEGVRRRLEIVGDAGGVRVYDDFAHHPTAVAETLAAVRDAYPGRRVWAVFEPRSASSCRKVFQRDFARAFRDGGADETVIATVFRSTLPDEERLSVADLVDEICRAGRKARHVGDAGQIIDTIVAERRDGDVVVIMSNGGFDNIHRRLLARLRESGVPRTEGAA